jgi:LAO/AO transport system kinase
LPTTDHDLAALLAHASSGERRALGRLLSIVERSAADAERVDALVAGRTPAYIVGVTGAPGAGKSTIVGRLAACATAAGQKVAVLAVDPSSPLHGGAILGDRVRMDGVVAGEVFIRSMASRGHHGGLAAAVPCAVRVLAATGFDVVFVETVGVGQVEIEVAGAADTTVVLVTPGWGDAIQANKSGLLEVADLFVVNKSDTGDADAACRDLAHMLDLGAFGGASPAARRPEIVRTSASRGDGVADAWEAIVRHRRACEADGELARRRRARYLAEVRTQVQSLLGASIDAELVALEAIADDRRAATVGETARQVVERILTTRRTDAREGHR